MMASFKDLPLVLDPKRSHLLITRIKTMPDMPGQVSPEIEIIRAEMIRAGGLYHLNLCITRSPVIGSGEFQI